ncbi:hypothetical protein ABZ922_37115 [Streptomyces shenzhenensis]|uniref:hypothetical protein n=1 Tax=Streptomyces shenzhenensis TaxID=943815 RepID=UPI0033CA2DA5
MIGFDATHLPLTRSFRFGPLLAEQANRWLAFTGTPIRLTDTDTISTAVGLVTSPDTVLCRINIGAMTEAMRLISNDHHVALTRGGHTLVAPALAAQDLKDSRRTSHPELVLFGWWGELQDYAERHPAGGGLQPSWNSSIPTAQRPSSPRSTR